MAYSPEIEEDAILGTIVPIANTFTNRRAAGESIARHVMRAREQSRNCFRCWDSFLTKIAQTQRIAETNFGEPGVLAGPPLDALHGAFPRRFAPWSPVPIVVDRGAVDRGAMQASVTEEDVLAALQELRMTFYETPLQRRLFRMDLMTESIYTAQSRQGARFHAWADYTYGGWRFLGHVLKLGTFSVPCWMWRLLPQLNPALDEAGRPHSGLPIQSTATELRPGSSFLRLMRKLDGLLNQVSPERLHPDVRGAALAARRGAWRKSPPVPGGCGGRGGKGPPLKGKGDFKGKGKDEREQEGGGGKDPWGTGPKGKGTKGGGIYGTSDAACTPDAADWRWWWDRRDWEHSPEPSNYWEQSPFEPF